MRPTTRRLLALLLLALVGLLALGALPGSLGTGDPYRLTAEPTDATGPAVDVTNASERRWPYLTEALTAEDHRSSGYRTGRYGLKEPFTHSPFDELDALAQRDPEARDGEAFLVEYEERRYRVRVEQSD